MSYDKEIVEEQGPRKKTETRDIMEAFKSHTDPFYSKHYRKDYAKNKNEGLTMDSVNQEILKIIARTRYV